MVADRDWKETFEETALPAYWSGLMPAGKMRIGGGVGTHISVTTFILLDPYVKRGHVAPSPERKGILCSEVLSELGSMLGYEKSSPAPTTTQLRRSATPVVTWARRWIRDEFPLEFKVSKIEYVYLGRTYVKEKIIETGPRARLIAALDKLGFHERDFLWKAIIRASYFRKNPAPEGLVSLKVFFDRIYADPMEFFENQREPSKYRFYPPTDTEVAETAKLISKIVIDRTVFRIVTLARWWIAEKFNKDSPSRSHLVQSLKALTEDKRDLILDCMESASLDRGPARPLDHVMKPELLGVTIKSEPEAGNEIRNAVHLISEVVAAQDEKGGAPRPYAMRFVRAAAQVWTEWTGRSFHRTYNFHIEEYAPVDEGDDEDDKEKALQLSLFFVWLNEQLSKCGGGHIGEDLVIEAALGARLIPHGTN